MPFLWPTGHTPAGIGQFVAPFHEAYVRVPVNFQPGPRFGADGLFCLLTHTINLNPASTATSASGENWRRQGTPVNFLHV